MSVIAVSPTIKSVTTLPLTKCTRSAMFSIILTIICCLLQSGNSFLTKSGRFSSSDILSNVRHSRSGASLDVTTANPMEQSSRITSSTSPVRTMPKEIYCAALIFSCIMETFFRKCVRKNFLNVVSIFVERVNCNISNIPIHKLKQLTNSVFQPLISIFYHLATTVSSPFYESRST